MLVTAGTSKMQRNWDASNTAVPVHSHHHEMHWHCCANDVSLQSRHKTGQSSSGSFGCVVDPARLCSGLLQSCRFNSPKSPLSQPQLCYCPPAASSSVQKRRLQTWSKTKTLTLFSTHFFTFRDFWGFQSLFKSPGQVSVGFEAKLEAWKVRILRIFAKR